MAAPIDPVVLRGNHVWLEPLSHRHEDELARVCEAEWLDLFSNSAIAPVDAASAREYVDEALGGWERGSYLPFVVRSTEDDRLIGATRYGDVDLQGGRLEIGWTWYVPDARGTAVNPECKLLLLRHAFDVLGVRRVALKTGALNTRSRRAIEKLGAVCEGVLRQHAVQRDGRIRDTVMYSIVREEWPAVRLRLEQRLGR